MLNSHRPGSIAGEITTNGGLRIVSPGGLDVTTSARIAAARVSLSTAREASGFVPVSHPSGGVVVTGTLRQAGRIDAGEIQLTAGVVEAAGVFNAADERGGRVTISGDLIAVLDSAQIDASGESDRGGEILIGGEYRGGAIDGQRNARRTFVAPGARLRAEAGAAGTGGRITVWADEVTRFLGRVSARGGEKSGGGGFAEVSGKGVLDYRGLADLTAASGSTGTLLLDPTDLTITGAGSDTAPTFGSFSGDMFAGGANNTSTISIGTGAGDTNATLLKQLATANVVVTTTSAGAGTGNLIVNGAIVYIRRNWSSSISRPSKRRQSRESLVSRDSAPR